MRLDMQPEEMDPDPWEQLSRQEKEEDKRILAMATERFDKAFDLIFGGNKDEPA